MGGSLRLVWLGLFLFATGSASGEVVVELVPDHPAPYVAGESLTVDVWLHSEVSFGVTLDVVQFDFTDSDTALSFSPTFTFDYSSIPDDIGGYVGIGNPALPAPYTANLLACFCPMHFILLYAGASLHIGSIEVYMPESLGTYRVDVLNADEPDLSLGARIWTGPVCIECPDGGLWRAYTGEITGGTFDFVVTPPIPTVSTWGMTTMTFLLLAAGCLVMRQRSAARSRFFAALCVAGSALTLSGSASADPADIPTRVVHLGVDSGLVGATGERGIATVTDCTFSANTARSGGGMYNNYSSPRVTNCTLSGNTATSSGGGMYNDSNGNPTVTNCTFSGNAAWSGGGMFNTYYSSPTVTNCTFSGNAAAGGGAGMYNANGSAGVTNCTFSGNTASSGGGMYNNGSGGPTVSNCTFSGNTASSGSGGGMFNTYYSSPTVTNCTFSGNTASSGSGGGMFNTYDSSPTVTNCTFSGNTATSGGGMYGGGTVTNCIFWGDSPNEIVFASSKPTIRFTDMQGGFPVGAVNGGGNLYQNPTFMRPPDPGPDATWGGTDDDYGDLRLQAGSPCTDTGDPAFVPQPGETDLDGHVRVLCDRVDMGAYEFGVGDYDCNRTVELPDFAAWDACMTGPDAGPYAADCVPFDFDFDGDVDLTDVASFMAAFTGSP